MHLTYRYRVKNHLGLLNAQARAVNYVWNFVNDRQRDALKWSRKWPSAFEFQRLTAGSSKELGLQATTINKICVQYERSRRLHRRPKLRYRGRKSLGWVPIKGTDLKRHGDAFRFAGVAYRVFGSRALPAGKICDGTNFAQDACGNWFLNIVIDLPDGKPRDIVSGVGVDLGLKDLATLSTGEAITNPRHVQASAERLAKAQRAGKAQLARKLHAKVANARNDYLHKLSHRIVRDFDYIAVGNVNAAGLAKTSMAKSVNDASWSSLRFMLRYKAIAHGAWYEEVDERFTTQACSSCGVIPASSPKGRAALGIRHWVCSDCGASHDRDVNAAQNILARSGHRAPAEGIAA